MTVPEENRPKTTSTDDVIAPGDEGTAEQDKDNGATGRTLREAMEEAGLAPEDVRDEK